MKSLKDLLFEEIQKNKRMSRNELRELAKINKYDVSTADRKLRELTEEKLINKREQNGFIVEYFIEQKLSDDIQELDKLILQKLKCLKPSWENFEEIKRLQEALKSKFANTKKSALI